MKMRPVWVPLLFTAGVMLGCASTNRVLFFTKTSIGIDADTAPPTASIAYDRMDGYLGPRYENGGVPPVLSSLKTDLVIFNPAIRQLYATGDAAQSISSGAQTPPESLPLAGKKKLMFFGSSTTTGLKLGFEANGAPSSITLGFKRKEFSIIPLGTAKDDSGQDVDVYPSVLASLDMRVNSASLQNTSLALSQFFATGNAANALAVDPTIQAHLKVIAQTATKPIQLVRAVAPDIQARREKVADYVKTLKPDELSTLALALEKPAGEGALKEILLSISAAETASELDHIAQKIKLLFGKEL